MWLGLIERDGSFSRIVSVPLTMEALGDTSVGDTLLAPVGRATFTHGGPPEGYKAVRTSRIADAMDDDEEDDKWDWTEEKKVIHLWDHAILWLRTS